MYAYSIIGLNDCKNMPSLPFEFPFKQEFPAKTAHLSTGSKLSPPPAHTAQVQIRRREQDHEHGMIFRESIISRCFMPEEVLHNVERMLYFAAHRGFLMFDGPVPVLSVVISCQAVLRRACTNTVGKTGKMFVCFRLGALFHAEIASVPIDDMVIFPDQLVYFL